MTKTYIITIDEKEAPTVEDLESSLRGDIGLGYPSVKVVGDLTTYPTSLKVSNNISLPTYCCIKCGHEWVPKITNPTRCSSCKSKYWKASKGE